MRKIIVSEFITLDGIIEDPGGSEKLKFKHGGWTWPHHNKEIEKFKYDELFSGDALLLGRITYEGFAAAWPKMQDTGDFGERMNGMPKFVVSATMKNFEWNNSTMIGSDIVQKISELKEAKGKDILVFGSGSLVQLLIKNDLVDEYNLLVYPVILGAGKRLFKEGSNKNLKLLDTKKFSSGVVLLRYATDRDKINK